MSDAEDNISEKNYSSETIIFERNLVNRKSDFSSDDMCRYTTSTPICTETDATKDEKSNQEASANFGNSSESRTDEVILSVYWRKGLLGAAFYNMESGILKVMNDILDINNEFSILNSLFYQVCPSKVITSSKLTPKFISALKVLLHGDTKDFYVGKDLTDQSRLILLRGKEYSYEGCRRRVLTLRLTNTPDNFTDEEHIRYIHSLLDLNLESMVHALGLLLKSLDKSYFHMNLDMKQKEVPLQAIYIISLEDIVMMDAESYEALQIFNKLSHPSNFKAGVPGSNKEGLSIYGIFNRCKTIIGSQFMRVLFLHPSRNMAVLNDRLDMIEFCFDPKNSEFVSTVQDCLKFIYNISKIIARIISARASIKDWKSLHKTMFYATLLGELSSTKKNYAKLFKRISDCLTDDLYEAIHIIDSVIDFQESEKQDRFVVQQGIDEELDRKKQKYSRLPPLMTTLAEEELDSLPEYIKECSILYIPEIGYLLAIPFWKDEISDEELQLEGLEFMFQVGGIVHYKSSRCRELDAVLGDCVVQITEHECCIMIKLIQYLQAHLTELANIVDLAAELDCMISLASVAHENNYVRPSLTNEKILEIKNGRHPLQEICVSDFVTNDTYASIDYGLMKILTGPNACGKSIYLKQVALIVYLAHIGSFVPASSATIGLVRHIFTRIQTVESIATRLSAFMIDLKQMSRSLYCSSSSSLVVVDEFGKGTSELDGLSLLTASLEAFLKREKNCPFVFVSTHFHHVVGLLPQSPYSKLETFEYASDEDGNIIYLYKLIPGSVRSSFTFKVAKSLGIKTEIINEAQKVLQQVKASIFNKNDTTKQLHNEYKEIARIISEPKISLDSIEVMKNLLQKLD